MRLSRDGHIVVCHDPDTLRLTGIPGKISDLTLEQLRSLDVGIWKGNAWRGEKIPLLEEVLDRQPAGKGLVIEIKGDSSSLPALGAVLKRTRCPHDQILLIGFDIDVIRQVKRLFPRMAALLLFDFERGDDNFQKRWLPHLESLIARAKDVGADGLNLCYSSLDDLGWIQAVKDTGLRAFVWTVDDPLIAHNLIAAGIEGLTTNRPGWMRAELEKSWSRERDLVRDFKSPVNG